MTLKLECLPPELLLYIAADVRGYHVPSFVALASASKILRAACAPILFSTIIVEPPVDKIEPTISRCMEALSANDLLSHVRRLFLRPSPRRHDWEQPLRPLTDLCCLPGTVEVDLETIAQARSARKLRYDGTDVDDDPAGNMRVLRLRDEEWLPAVHLIKALPNLRGVSFDARCDVVPSCLLESFHEALPRCRLSISKLQTVGEGPPAQPVSKPDDIAHVPVSNLNDITIHQVTFNPLILIEGSHGLETPFPSLNPFRMDSFYFYMRKGEAMVEKRATFRWQRLPESSTPSTNPALVSLTLHDNSTHLSPLSNILDTSTLRSLFLGRRQSYSSTVFQRMTESANFPNLKHLSLASCPRLPLNTASTQGGPAQPPDYLTRFLGRLPPLEHLEMQGSIPAYIVKGLLAHHGPALQKLTIRATSTAHTFTKEIFQLICEHCGVLQELQMPLQRTTSGIDEAAALDALGSIRSLHTLRLKLEWKYVVLEREGFSKPWPSQPSETSWAYDPLPFWTNQSLWTAWDQEPSFLSAGHPMPQPIYNGDIRDTLIRAAVDEKFARAAWDRLCQQGCRLRLFDLHSLSSMEPPIRHWDNWHSLRTVTILMEGHFLLQRSMADDDTVLSVDLTAEKLEESFEYEMPDELMEHFRRLWPSKSADGSWQDDWSSLPFPLTSIPTS